VDVSELRRAAEVWVSRKYVLRLWQTRTSFASDYVDITAEAFRSSRDAVPLFCFPVGGDRRVRAMVRDEVPWEGNGYRARRCAMIEVT
jgi:hypothetical protein